MRRIVTLVIILALVPLSVLAQGGEISATGSATVSVPPDNADIHIMIVTRDSKPDEAATENANIRKRVVKHLAAEGFGEKEIITVNYRVDTEYEYDRTSGSRKKIGYVAIHQVKLNTDDLTLIGSIIDKALEAGATEISSVNYFSSKIDDARRKALAGAVKKALSDAEVMASTLGGTVGDLVELSTGGGGRPIMQRNFSERAVAAKTEVVPDDLSVTVAVSGRWTFIAGGN